MNASGKLSSGSMVATMTETFRGLPHRELSSTGTGLTCRDATNLSAAFNSRYALGGCLSAFAQLGWEVTDSSIRRKWMLRITPVLRIYPSREDDEGGSSLRSRWARWGKTAIM